MKQIIFLLFLIVITALEISKKNYVTGSKIIKKKKDTRSKWSQRMITKIKKDPKIYQIMLLTNYENLEHLQMIQQLQENVPTLYFNDTYTKRKIQHLEEKISLKNPRDTTLFLIVLSSDKNNTQWTEETMAFVKKLSNVRIRPKCLILRISDSNETMDFEKFLQRMWQDLFLDITVLDVIKEQATIHQLNPFVTYKTKPFNSRTQLFPNKLRNLHGYPIKVGIFNRPPFVNLKRNKTNYPFDVSGPDAEVGKIFAETLNYRQVLVPSNEEDFGNFTCRVDQLSGLLSEVQKNKVQFISVTSAATRCLCKEEAFENPIFDVDHYAAFTPALKTKNFSFVIGNTLYNSILLTVLITITGWIIRKAFKFETTIWNWTVILEVLFGLSVDHQPQKLTERIIFGCFLIVNFYYSCNIFNSLTDFNYRVDQDREINTLNDLIGSGLSFGSDINVIRIIPYVVNQDNFTIWLQNAKVIRFQECVDNILDYKNITCIMRLTQAEWHVGFYKEQNLVKIVPEYMVSVGIGFIMEPGSPYAEKFQQIYRSLMEFALLKKWQLKNLPNATRYQQLGVKLDEELDQNNEDWKIESLLLGVLIFGYVLSFLSFLVEVALDYWKRKSRSQII